MTDKTIHSDLPIPPGEYLEEVISCLAMPKDELARRMDRPASKLSPIFKGEKAITPETAMQLEKVVGVPAHVWLGLESEYRLTLARREEQIRIQNEIQSAKKYPYRELTKLGAIAARPRAVDRVEELQRFFGVASLAAIPVVRRYQVAFRQGISERHHLSAEALAAWLRLGELAGRTIDCEPFQEDVLRGKLNGFRALTATEPSEFLAPLRTELSKSGVALVICPHFRGTRAHGATFWLTRKKAVLMLTIRWKWADIFWFSLFHEIGHVLRQNRDMVILDGADGTAGPDEERAADAFARRTLIPDSLFADFSAREIIDLDSIQDMASRAGVHTGIIVGRLQHENLIGHDRFNELRTRYSWADVASDWCRTAPTEETNET